jgi:hypothetical protein
MTHVIIAAAAQEASSGGFSWNDFADTVQSFATTLGIIVGGLFTYFKFFKDRVYRPRVCAIVEGGHTTIAREQFLMCRITMENKGSTKLCILGENTSIKLFRGRRRLKYDGVLWGSDPIGEVSVFDRHAWIESGETIADEQVFWLPSDDNGIYRVRFRLSIKNPQPSWILKWRGWQHKRADHKTDRSNKSPKEKGEEKADRDKNNEHAPTIAINAVTIVWPDQRWNAETDEEEERP